MKAAIAFENTDTGSQTITLSTLQSLAELLELKTRTTGGHSSRVVEWSMQLSRLFDLPEADARDIEIAAALHDIGKIGIPDPLLTKPNQLTPGENALMAMHPEYGWEVMRQIPGCETASLLVLHHHEMWNGEGYPSGLEGEDIPFGARIIAVADAFDVMTGHQPYRDGICPDDAIAHLISNSGTQFDPTLVEAFVNFIRSTEGRGTLTLLSNGPYDRLVGPALLPEPHPMPNEPSRGPHHHTPSPERAESGWPVPQGGPIFRQLIENGLDIVTLMSAEGQIQYESPSITKLLGYRPEELIGSQIERIVHPEDRETILRAIAAVLDGPETTETFEVRFQHLDETWKTFESDCKSFVGASGISSVVLNCRDVTDREHLESQLRQANRMEAVGRLSGGVAHDFNNLLTIIGGFSALLMDAIEPDHPTFRHVEAIKEASDRAASLTQQLLAFSRKQMLQPKVFDVNSAVGQVEKMLRRVIGENVELVTMLGEDVGRINADPAQLDQVIINLAVNARDAMAGGGRLVIETTNTEPSPHELDQFPDFGAKPGRYVMLSVSDTGSGMDTKTVSQIFEPFFTTKEQGAGTGLGLATVYGIVKQSGGCIAVHSDLNHGTTFKVFMPLACDPTESPEFVDKGSVSLPLQKTILLVEDEPVLRELICAGLPPSYNVLEAGNGVEGLNLVRNSAMPIDLVITDVIMPEMGGPEMAQQLKTLLPDTPVLYMSGYTDDQISKDDFVSEGLHFIQKPFTPTSLAQKVQKLL